MMRTLTALGASLGMLLAPSLAHAQERGALGQRGQFIISADRLFSLFSYSRVAQDQFTPGAGNSKQVVTSNGTAISLLWGGSPVVNMPSGPVINPFAVPRVGVDYMLTRNWTIGGNLVIFFTVGGNTGRDTTSNAGVTATNSADNPGQFLFGIEPRGGYVWPLTDLFSLWLRGGLSYYVETNKPTAQSNTTNQFALDLEPQIVFTPIPHVGFTAGLTGDIPLAGGHSSDNTLANGTTISQSAWSSIAFFGITVGMLAYF